MKLDKLKSWYFALVAAIIQMGSTLYFYLQIDWTPPTPSDDLASLQALPFVIFLFCLIVGVIILISTILLIINSDKTKKVGAVISIFLGIAAGAYTFMILANELIFTTAHPQQLQLTTVLLLVIQMLLLLAAGFYYFSKERLQR